jgi:hypothetical protein
MTNDGTDVEPILQLTQDIGAHVNDGDFVGFFA